MIVFHLVDHFPKYSIFGWSFLPQNLHRYNHHYQTLQTLELGYWENKTTIIKIGLFEMAFLWRKVALRDTRDTK
jgi:hypothetical protein